MGRLAEKALRAEIIAGGGTSQSGTEATIFVVLKALANLSASQAGSACLMEQAGVHLLMLRPFRQLCSSAKAG